MKFYGQLKEAVLELKAGVIATVQRGLIYFNTTNDRPYLDDGAGSAKQIMLEQHLPEARRNTKAQLDDTGTGNEVEGILPYTKGGTSFGDLTGNAGLALKVRPDELGYEFGKAGAGSKSEYAIFDAEDQVLTGFTNISITTTNPLNEDRSYQVDSFPATFPVVNLQERGLGKTHGINLQYRMTSGTAKLLIKDNLANTIAELDIDAKSSSFPVLLEPYVGDSLTTVQLEIQDVSSATGLVIDDVEFSDDPFKYKNLIEEHIITHSGHTSRDGSNRIVYATTNDNGGNILTTSNGLGYTRVEFLKPASFIVSASYIGVNSSEVQIVRADSLDAQVQRSRDSSATNGVTTTSMVGYAQAGDYISVRSSQAPNNQIENNFEIKAQVASDNLIATVKNGFIEEKLLSGDITGTGDIADFTFNNLVIGRRYFLSGRLIFETAGLDTQLRIRSASLGGGDVYDSLRLSNSNFGTVIAQFNVATSFIATSSTMYVNKTGNTGASSKINGNGSKDFGSYLQLHDYTGEFLSAIPTNAEPTANGVEYKVNEKWFGKQVYARSWDVSVNTSVGTTDHLLATTSSGLSIHKYDFIGLESGFWRSLQHGGTNGFIARFRYNTANGQITVRTDGVAFTQERFTLYYTK